MVILHAFLALISGFLVTAVLLGLLNALLSRPVPDWSKSGVSIAPGYAFVNLATTFLSTAAGGCVTAWIGSASPAQHVMILGIVFLVLAAISVLQERGKQPVWFLLAQVVIPPLGALAGGLLWLRFTGVL
ncbi:hypothetical protein ACOBR2_02975 [Telmatobacter bradus]|uniref:hypothetical protein n=1 Tax=Telmatobacter bradus TaxID=474953 RepID=UPI003B439273